MRAVVALLAVSVALGACAGGGDEAGSTTSTAPATTAAGTTATTAADPVVPTESLADEALAAFKAWVQALHEGDYSLAWDLMAPSSQAALGSFELFESWGPEMTEGWGSWAEATGVWVSIEEDLAGRTVAAISGVVTKEGMTEEGTTKVFLDVDDTVVISPFEEFGNVAEGLSNPTEAVPVPEGSGSGRRIVYSNSAQRVWIIEEDETVVDTYLVSGREGVPDSGVYEVFSKSEIAYAGHDDITMRYMVRFTYAESGLAIGFHSIPNTASGEPLQTEEQLGEFHSAGCVRQSLGHAAALYDWASEGTVVHVIG